MGSMTPWGYLIVYIPLFIAMDIDGEWGIGETNGIDNVPVSISFHIQLLLDWYHFIPLIVPVLVSFTYMLLFSYHFNCYLFSTISMDMILH